MEAEHRGGERGRFRDLNKHLEAQVAGVIGRGEAVSDQERFGAAEGGRVDVEVAGN